MSTDKIEKLEARCDDLQAAVDQLLRRVAALERQQNPGVMEQAKDEGSFDLTMTIDQANAGLTEIHAINDFLRETDQTHDSDISPLAFTMEGSSLEGGEEGGAAGAADIDDLLNQAMKVSQGIYDDDMRDVLDLCTSQLQDICSSPAAAAVLVESGGHQEAINTSQPESVTATRAIQPGALEVLGQEEVTLQAEQQQETGQLTGVLAQGPVPDVAETHDVKYHPEGNVAGPSKGVLHLVLGDSIAVYLTLPVPSGHSVLNLAVRGNTWGKEGYLIDQHLREWQQEATAENCQRGSVFIWLGGNDAYGRPGDRRREVWHEEMYRVLQRLRDNTVILAGPTPRLWADADEQYENTPAFRADGLLRKAAKENGFAFVPYLGRLLTCMHHRKHVVRRRVAQAWFAKDGTHLSREGYEKVSQKLHRVFM